MTEEKDNPQALFEQGRRYKQIGDFPQAVVLFKQAIDKDSNFKECYQELMETYTLSGDFSSAKDLYHTAEKKFPTDVELLNLYGLLCFKQKKYHDAIVVLEKALSFEELPWTLTVLAGCEYESKRYVECVEHTKRANELDPTSLDALDLLYKSLIRLKQFEAANDVVCHLLDRDPNRKEAWTNLVSLCRVLKDAKGEEIAKKRLLAL